MTENPTDLSFLRQCLDLAKSAQTIDEVPVGALIVNNQTGEIVAKGMNRRETLSSPIAHAEVIAVHRACKKLGTWRLSGHTLYSSLEPCVMCSGVILQTRLDRVVFSATDPKGGGQSLFNLMQDPRLNHHVSLSQGILEAESRNLLRSFFREKRQKTRKK